MSTMASGHGSIANHQAIDAVFQHHAESGMVWVLLQSWQSYHARQAAVSLAALAKPGDIVMLSSETCAYCKAANRFMTQHQIPFSECFIETDAACAERYRAQQSPGTPTLLVRGQRLVGFDPERIAQVLGGA